MQSSYILYTKINNLPVFNLRCYTFTDSTKARDLLHNYEKKLLKIQAIKAFKSYKPRVEKHRR